MPKEKKKPGRPKGLPKTGGRKKGTPNKNNRRLREVFAERGFDYAAEFIQTLSKLEPPHKADVLVKMARYFMQPLRPDLEELLEPSARAEAEDDARLSTDDLLKLVKMQ